MTVSFGQSQRMVQFRAQYNDRRDDRVGRPHHQEHGRTDPGRGREDVRRRQEEMSAEWGWHSAVSKPKNLES